MGSQFPNQGSSHTLCSEFGVLTTGSPEVPLLMMWSESRVLWASCRSSRSKLFPSILTATRPWAAALNSTSSALPSATELLAMVSLSCPWQRPSVRGPRPGIRNCFSSSFLRTRLFLSSGLHGQRRPDNTARGLRGGSGFVCSGSLMSDGVLALASPWEGQGSWHVFAGKQTSRTNRKHTHAPHPVGQAQGSRSWQVIHSSFLTETCAVKRGADWGSPTFQQGGPAKATSTGAASCKLRSVLAVPPAHESSPPQGLWVDACPGLVGSSRPPALRNIVSKAAVISLNPIFSKSPSPYPVQWRAPPTPPQLFSIPGPRLRSSDTPYLLFLPVQTWRAWGVALNWVSAVPGVWWGLNQYLFKS